MADIILEVEKKKWMGIFRFVVHLMLCSVPNDGIELQNFHFKSIFSSLQNAIEDSQTVEMPKYIFNLLD